MELKLYIQDCGWAGSILVVSTSEEEARKLMKKEMNYDPKDRVMEFEIKDGFLFSNYGDL